MLPRIYADFNGLGSSRRFPGRLRVPLDVIGTLRDLSNAGIKLHDGLRLRIYDWSDEAEDFEADVTVYFDSEQGVWVGELDEPDCVYVPKRDRTSDPRLLCLRCRRDVAVTGVNISARVESSERCPHCGTLVNEALGRPAT